MRENETHPKRTPPKATKRPIIMAGAAEPTASSGFFNAKPIARGLDGTRKGIGVRYQTMQREMIVLGSAALQTHSNGK